MSLGRRIRELREKRGFTQKYMADRLGMGRSNFGHIENDRVNPSSDDLEKIADILNTSTDYLLGRTEHPFGARRVLSAEDYAEGYDDEPTTEEEALEELYSVVHSLSEGPYNKRQFRSDVWKKIDEELEHFRSAHGFEVECTPDDVIQLCKEINNADFTKEIIDMLERLKKETRSNLPTWATRKDVRDFKRMLEEDAPVMFDGVPLDEEDKKKVLKVMEAIFWDAKKKNKKKPIEK